MKKIVLKNFDSLIDRMPLVKLSNLINVIEFYDSSKHYNPSKYVIVKYRAPGLPEAKNTIHVQNKLLNKEEQAEAFKGKVKTVKTFLSAPENKRFIAKMKSGWRQKGQMIDRIPENESDYIYQPFVNLIGEYRAVCYYINGDYVISGIYRKIGSNISLSSVKSGSRTYDILSDQAVRSMKALGYAFGGVDIAIVSVKNSEDVNESIFSSEESNVSTNHVVTLEVNTLPSLTNPMIFTGLIKSILTNAQL